MLLATSFRRKSAMVFWLTAIVAALFWSYSEQNKFRDTCGVTNGVVVDEVYLRIGRSDTWCPQISYYIDGKEYFFADKTMNHLSVGDNVKVLFQKDRTDNALVYDLGFWINYRVIILTWLIAFVLFGLIWGLTQKFSRNKEILPSNTPL